VTSPELTGYQVGRRQRAEGPWITDWNDVTYATYEEAAAECEAARAATGVPWEVCPVYTVPEPPPEEPPTEPPVEEPEPPEEP